MKKHAKNVHGFKDYFLKNHHAKLEEDHVSKVLFINLPKCNNAKDYGKLNVQKCYLLEYFNLTIFSLFKEKESYSFFSF